MKINTLLFVFLIPFYSFAQCVEVNNCESDVIPICYYNSNMPGLWAGQNIWDDARKSADLVEGMGTISIRLKDNCGNSGWASGVACHLYMDLNSDGQSESFVYTDSVQQPGMLWANLFGNTQQITFDSRQVPDSSKYFFVVEHFPVQDMLDFRLAFATLSGAREEPYLPDAGPIKAVWLLQNTTGYDTLCTQQYRMRDCQKPQISCTPWVPVFMDDTGPPSIPGGEHCVWDYITAISDNSTPEAFIKQRIELHYRITGNEPATQTCTYFDCEAYYSDSLYLVSMAIDLAGNLTKCSTQVYLSSNCPAGFKLCAYTEQGKGVTGWYLRPEGSPGAANFTNLPAYAPPDKPCFSTPIFWINQFWQNIQLTPYDTFNYIKGVSTFDLVLISKHILGIEPLNSPYKMIAADANRSGTITTLDIVELRKLILGVSTKLPQNDSWRFILKDYVFPDPQNPFANVFPEKLEFTGTGWAPLIYKTFQFVAVKIGDINLNALPLQNNHSEDRNLYDSLTLMMPHAQSGELVPIYFEKARLEGFQWSLQNVEPELIVPGPGLAEDNFAWSAEQRTLRCSWISPDASAQDFDASRPICWLKLKQAPVQLENGFASEAYEAGAVQRVIRFRSSALLSFKDEKVFVSPNPTHHNTWIQGDVMQAGNWVFQVTDASGKVIWNEETYLEKGAFQREIPGNILAVTGVYFWTARAGNQLLSGKLIKM
ncbi:MAG: T9SS type A sorting domain-containing protein [Chitinophagales bacterium]|nr:T9SS type A sorting domain-containing protein [Chitinophagales bacterium]